MNELLKRQALKPYLTINVHQGNGKEPEQVYALQHKIEQGLIYEDRNVIRLVLDENLDMEIREDRNREIFDLFPYVWDVYSPNDASEGIISVSNSTIRTISFIGEMNLLHPEYLHDSDVENLEKATVIRKQGFTSDLIILHPIEKILKAIENAYQLS